MATVHDHNPNKSERTAHIVFFKTYEHTEDTWKFVKR